MKFSLSSMATMTRIVLVFCLPMVVFLTTPCGNVEEEINSDPIEHSYKSNVFAKPKYVNIDTESRGRWSRSADETKSVWEFEVREKATSLNFGFDEFVLPPSAVLTICDEKGSRCQQFLPSNNQAHLEKWTPILKGNVAKFSLSVDTSEKHLLKLRLSTINLGFRKNKSAGTSQECLIDVRCADQFPQIADWDREIQSVGLLSIEGTRFCTGVLLNNLREDFTPYFLTARHCGINAQNAASVVVHWNYENSTCRLGEESNNMEGDGSLETFNSGTTFLADLQRSDFTLLRLNEPVVEEANAYFAGWSASAASPSDVTSIHHANTEEKRITFGAGQTEITRHFGVDADPNLDHIRVLNWDISSTSGGSSGGPLFDKNHRVVGQLHGGLAACGNEESDWFGRFHTSWEGDEVPERQLSVWLDPDGTGQTETDGIWNEVMPLALQISIQNTSQLVCAGDETASIQVNIANGIGPFTYSIDGGESFQIQNIFQNLGAGIYSIVVKDDKDNTSAIVPFIIQDPAPLELSAEQAYNQISLTVDQGTAPFLYSLNGAISLDSIFRNVPRGTNLFTVIDANGCKTELTIDISYDDFVGQLQTVNEITCNGDANGSIAIQHSGTVAPYTYQLNNGPISDSNLFENLAPGIYNGKVVDALGNVVLIESIELIDPPVLQAELIQVEENILVDVSGGVEPYLFSYDGGEFIDIPQYLVTENFSTIVVQDANGCELELESVFTSTSDYIENVDINLYPNPSSGSIWIQSESNLTSFRVLNLNGQIVKSVSLEDGIDRAQAINVQDLGPGMYFFEAHFYNGAHKLMKFTVL